MRYIAVGHTKGAFSSKDLLTWPRSLRHSLRLTPEMLRVARTEDHAALLFVALLGAGVEGEVVHLEAGAEVLVVVACTSRVRTTARPQIA